jgi:hypothetical protein
MTAITKKQKWDTAGKILMIIIIALVWTMCLLVPPVSAVTTTVITAENVNQYSIEASQGHYIYEIIINSLPMGTNQTHILTSNGATFLLEIKTWQDWAIYNNFNVSMTYPNGTVETVQKTSTRISDNSYKTTIQPVFAQLQGYTPAWKIDLEIGLNPTTVMFTPNNILEFTPNTSIPFTVASGQFSGETTTVYGYEISIDEFQSEIVNYNPWSSVTNLASQFLNWTWGSILSFIGMIPVLGPQLVTMLDAVGTIFGTLIFWIIYTVTHFYLVLIGGETILLVFAFLLAGKKPKPEKFIKNLINYHVWIGHGFLWVVMLVWHGLLFLTQVVANIIH